jgi:uncharacterized C2H2 Zn-finger protein
MTHHSFNIMDTILDTILDASLKRMKRNKQLWDDICDASKSDDEMEECARHNMAFKTRKFYNRENHKDSFWYKFVMGRNLSDINGRDGKLSEMFPQ